MSETQSTSTQPSTAPSTLSSVETAAKNNALIAYGLMVVGLFTGIFWIIGFIWAILKKGEAQGTVFEDHYTNIVKTFWWGLGLSIIGFFLMFIVVGYLFLLGVWIWSIYRIVKGLARITSNKSYYAS